jgi:hypothetical protein
MSFAELVKASMKGKAVKGEAARRRARHNAGATR